MAPIREVGLTPPAVPQTSPAANVMAFQMERRAQAAATLLAVREAAREDPRAALRQAHADRRCRDRPPRRHARICRTCGGHPAAVPAASPARQGRGAFSCRDVAGANAGARPCPRQSRAAVGDGGRLRRHRCRRGVGVERRLRGARSRTGAVSAQIRRCDALARGLADGDARDADPPRRKARVANPPLGGIRTLPAILDAVGTRLCRRRGRSADPPATSFSNPRPAPGCWRFSPSLPKRRSP
jgi:hypothetical protein